MKQNKTLRYKASEVEITIKAGQILGKHIQKGDVICLDGNLGTGKTVFAQGLAKGLDINEYITSPTFNILNIYNGNVDMYHYDLYRLDSEEELYDIGFYDLIEGNGVSVIEWANKFDLGLSNFISVKIDYCYKNNQDCRIIELDFENYKSSDLKDMFMSEMAIYKEEAIEDFGG